MNETTPLEAVRTTVLRYNELLTHAKATGNEPMRRALTGDLLRDLKILKDTVEMRSRYDETFKPRLRRVREELASIEDRFMRPSTQKTPAHSRGKKPEKVGPQSPHTEAWLRYLIGVGVGGIVIFAMLTVGNPFGALPLALFTVLCMAWAALPFPIVASIQLFKLFTRKKKGEEYVGGWLLPLLCIACAMWGYAAILIEIGQTFWGWSVF